MKSTLRCQLCHREYLSSVPLWKCQCGGLLSIEFHARFPLDKIKRRKSTLWRYREALPIEQDEHIVSFDEGFTPLVEEHFFGKKVLLKQDHLFPSGSYKDRGATVLISKLKELGIKKVVEDSSGNAGAAIAAYCAKANIDCHIYVPKRTSPGKLLQIQQYGAHLHKIQGSREDTAKAALKQAETTYYASHSWNPYFFHGTKTVIFEVVEQIGWNTPDILMVPVGNGTLLYGVFIGLKELQRENIISTLPKIIGVQAENCAPLASVWKNHGELDSHKKTKETIAEGIAIKHPVRRNDILSAIKETKGALITVKENEILDALHYTLRKGYCIEPTSAVAIAGFKKSHLGQGKSVVIPLTGHGLKKG
ncbi:MAG: threonine synthase [Candidatus Thermoplasmatota archaeon]|nr:threonine synthase [Candidatus Thermoplasmatota archaeon]